LSILKNEDVLDPAVLLNTWATTGMTSLPHPSSTCMKVSGEEFYTASATTLNYRHSQRRRVSTFFTPCPGVCILEDGVPPDIRPGTAPAPTGGGVGGRMGALRGGWNEGQIWSVHLESVY